MMGTIFPLFLFGALAGIDNLQVCTSIGLLSTRGRRMHLLALAFSLCEIGAPLLGLMLGRSVLGFLAPSTTLAGPLMTLVCGVIVLACAFRGEDAAEVIEGPAVFGLPLSLSLDNLIAGIGISSISCPIPLAALLIGGVGALMSCAGLYAGSWLRGLSRRILPMRIEGMVGAYLCLLAVRMLLEYAV